VDHQSRPGVRRKKRQRDRLIAWATRHPDWVLGFEDEVWWSRLTQPVLAAWTADQPLRLVAPTVAKTDPDPKALACYGLLRADTHEVWLRFVDGRPVSGLTTQFLAACCAEVARAGKTALLLVWDNASWHRSAAVRGWIRAHNRAVKTAGAGVRLVVCFLPTKSPWLNPIEPHWVHGKRAVVEPAGRLSAAELEARVCTYFRVEPAPHLSLTQQVS
jgi:hypothetical protein